MSTNDQTTDPKASSEPEIDLQQVARLLLRRRWLVGGGALLALVIGAVVTIRSPRIYKASANVLIEQSAPDVLDNVREVYDLGAGAYWATKEYYETQYNVIRSRPVAQKAAQSLGLAPAALAEAVRAAGPASLEARAASDPLYGLPEVMQQKLRLLGLADVHDRDDLLEALGKLDAARYVQSLVRVEPVKDSHLVGIAVESTDASQAALVANAVADAYIEYNLDQRTSATRSAVDWLADQMRELKEKLKDSELELYEFKKANNIVSISMEDRQTMISESLSQLNRSLSESRAKRIALEARRSQIQKARQAGLSLESLEEISSNALILDLKSTYSKLRQEETDLAQKYTPDHPKLQAARDKVALVQGQLQGEVDKIVRGLEQSFDTALDTEHRLEYAIEKVKAEALEINKREIEYNRLRRERDNTQSLYDLVLKREKEADLTQLLKVNNVRKLEAATTSEFPIRPRVKLNMMVALVLGLLLGVGLAFLIDYFDNTLKSQAQVEQRLGLPFLGIIPAIRGDKGSRLERDKERDLYVVDHPRSSVAECCRTVRTNLLFMSHERQARRILVTSSGPQEGKTTSVINLAITMAQSGTRTVIVDTDLRRPRLHKSFGVPNDVGISNLILGETTLEKAVRASGVDNLDLILCGPIPPNPAELLHAESFARLVDALADRYDRVFFDSPPVSAVADALVLATRADGVVLVVQAGHTTWHAALDARRRIEGVGGRLFGAVLNDVDLDNKRGGEGYRYYYYYHSGYGEEGKGT